MDYYDTYGQPAERVEAVTGVKRCGTHVAVIRFTYEYGPSNTSHQREMVRVGEDLNGLIDDLTAIAVEAGIR
ncbi:hypothetical protein [Nonomuraea sp. B19D2]|uniref:hypothetical protein n=1 Tax=Nonomuraea sp. B19D2 TaxID=3159561 RepID=UPI0032DBB749